LRCYKTHHKHFHPFFSFITCVQNLHRLSETSQQLLYCVAPCTMCTPRACLPPPNYRRTRSSISSRKLLQHRSSRPLVVVSTRIISFVVVITYKVLLLPLCFIFYWCGEGSHNIHGLVFLGCIACATPTRGGSFKGQGGATATQYF